MQALKREIKAKMDAQAAAAGANVPGFASDVAMDEADTAYDGVAESMLVGAAPAHAPASTGAAGARSDASSGTTGGARPAASGGVRLTVELRGGDRLTVELRGGPGDAHDAMQE
jgi:hypothetical protein